MRRTEEEGSGRRHDRSRLADALHHVPQIGKVNLDFALVDFDDIPLMQLGKMVRLLPIADATSRIDLSCMGACMWPLHMKDVVYADILWQGARRAGLPAQTKHWGLRMARGIRDPAMDAVVVILCYPYGVQS